MERETLAGHYYTITSKSGCTVTDSTGTLNQTVPAGGQLTVQAPSDKLIFSEDDAIVFKANFNAALALLGQPSGGGSSGGFELPSGYTRVDYLQTSSAATQFAISDVFYVDAFSADVVPLSKGNRPRIVYAGKNGQYRQCVENYETGYSICVGRTNSTQYKTGRAFSINERISFSVDYKKRIFTANGTSYTAERLFNVSPETADCPLSVPHSMPLRLYSCNYTLGDSEASLVPAVAPNGKPCLFDVTHSKPYFQAGGGTAIVGLSGTTALTNLLIALPYKEVSEAAALKIDLPSTVNADDVNRLCVLAGELKNWEITVN